MRNDRVLVIPDKPRLSILRFSFCLLYRSGQTSNLLNYIFFPFSRLSQASTPPRENITSPSHFLSSCLGVETMVSLTLSKKESLFFITTFIFSFYILPQTFVLIWTISFLSLIAKRTEIYFLWSILAPRITGSAVCILLVCSLFVYSYGIYSKI